MAFNPVEGTKFGDVDQIQFRKQCREESSLEKLNATLGRVHERFQPEIEVESPDLGNRATMAAAVLAMMKAAPTYRDAREGMKQLQGIFGHSVTKTETHNHLTLDARLAAGIAEAERIGLLGDGQGSRVVVAEVKSHGDQARRDGQPGAAGAADLRAEEGLVVERGPAEDGGAGEVPEEPGRQP